ncbi:hypothetical protein CLV75_1148 [Ruegeria conchae]|uniref:Uncharacterized protein n=1 Tax=Ruegeria conchae TaxID=981384 RepID=A0A497ZXP5_9RHOB|nr:hypothetical protein CLV75_1148 [Ruegeria conchae]
MYLGGTLTMRVRDLGHRVPIYNSEVHIVFSSRQGRLHPCNFNALTSEVSKC